VSAEYTTKIKSGFMLINKQESDHVKFCTEQDIAFKYDFPSTTAFFMHIVHGKLHNYKINVPQIADHIAICY